MIVLNAHSLPLATVRRRDGLALLALAAPSVLVLAALMLAQVPPSLRDGAVALALILVAITVGTGLLCFMWACAVLWPWERRRLLAAMELRRLRDLPPDAARPALRPPLVAGGLLLGGALWTVLSTLGFFAAPLLWVAVGALHLGIAWRIRTLERRRGVVYYEAPAASMFAGRRHLFVLHEEGEMS